MTLITEEPSEEYDERSRFKYPNIACELLTCDVPALNESLSRDNELLEKLYSFIDKDPPLNPLLASFLSRTLGVLIVKRLDQVSFQRIYSLCIFIFLCVCLCARVCMCGLFIYVFKNNIALIIFKVNFCICGFLWLYFVMIIPVLNNLALDIIMVVPS